MNYLSGKITVSMFPECEAIKIDKIKYEDLPDILISVITNQNFIRTISAVLNKRINVTSDKLNLTTKDVLYVADYHGTKILSMDNKLPIGSVLTFYKITFKE